MSESGIKDLVSYRIVRQILDHIYTDQEMTEKDFLGIFRTFQDLGNKWEYVIQGDPKSIHALMEVLKAFVKIKNADE